MRTFRPPTINSDTWKPPLVGNLTQVAGDERGEIRRAARQSAIDRAL